MGHLRAIDCYFVDLYGILNKHQQGSTMSADEDCLTFQYLYVEMDVAMGLRSSTSLAGEFCCQGFKNEINGPKHLFPSTSSTA